MGAVDPLRSLKDHEVVLTGHFRSGTQAELQRLARGRGARVNDKHVSSKASILVIGAPSGHWKYYDHGIKIEEALQRRRAGQRIYFISEAEFRQLVGGQGLTRQQTAAALTSGEPVYAGLPYRQAPTSRRRTGSLTINLDQLDRATVAHQRLCNRLARAVEEAGHQPLSPWPDGPAYDLAWMRGEQLWLVEVKTISSNSERQQVRLGLGQVLDYAATMRSKGFDVQPVVALTGQPASGRWRAVCHGVDVILCWPTSWHAELEL